MGHRANLVLIENNKPKIYYSHWDGNKIPNILAQGMDFCEKYFVTLNEDHGLMDNAWAEGGILIDKSTKKILFFDGEFLDTIALQNKFISFLQQNIWINWSISWAFRGNVDFAEHLNLMNRYILADGSKPEFYKIDDWNSLIEELDNEWAHKSLVTIIHNKEIVDYILVGHWTEINFCIAEGEKVKEKTPSNFKVSLKNQIKESEIEDVLLIDYDTKQIFVCWSYNTDDRHIEAINKIWNGWKPKRQTTGVAFNFDYTGREKTYIKISEKEFIKYLNEWKLLEYK